MSKFWECWNHSLPEYRQVDASQSGLNVFSQKDCVSDSVRINLGWCVAAVSIKPLPVTNQACHFWLSMRLLVFYMCSGGSFAVSEITICKDEGSSGEAAGLWQVPFHLPPFPCCSLSLPASILLSAVTLLPSWLFNTCCLSPPSFSSPLSSISVCIPTFNSVFLSHSLILSLLCLSLLALCIIFMHICMCFMVNADYCMVHCFLRKIVLSALNCGPTLNKLETVCP